MPNEWREVLAKRRRTSKTKRLYENDQPTNKFSFDGMVGTSLHYEDAGEWLEVDPRIVPSDEPGWDWEMVKSHWRFLVRNGGWFAAEKQGVGIGFRLERIAYLNIETKEHETIRTANYTTPTVEAVPLNNDLLPNPKGLLTWANLFPGVNFEIHISGDGLHEEIKVSQAARDAMPHPPYPAADTYLVMVYEVDWGQVPGLADDDGDIDYDTDFERTARLYLKNYQGEIVTALPASRAWPEDEPVDAEGEPIQIPLRKRFVKVGGQHYLLVGAPVLALNALPEGTIIFDPDVDEQVGANADDAHQRKTQAVTDHDFIRITAQTIDAARYAGGFRFQTVDIPNSPASVDVANMQTHRDDANSPDNLDATIYGNDVDSANDFSTEADIWGRALTSASVGWTDSGSGEVWITSPSIVTIISELVARPGWAANQHMALLVLGDAAASQTYYAESHNDVSANAAKLHIEYTAGGGQDYPVSVALARTAAMTGAAQAGALGSASLGRSVGVTDGGQGAGLAAISLARSAGLSDAGQSASLGAMNLARDGGVSASALAAALAAASLARQAGLTDAGVASALAAASLSRNAGMIATGQAASLGILDLGRADTISAAGVAAALASVSLARQTGVTGAGQAATLSDVSLTRSDSLSSSGQAAALASATLSRSGGITQTGSAEALASVLTEIFKGLSVTPLGLDYAVSFTLDRFLAVSSSAKADSLASVSLAKQQAVSLVAQALALAEVDFSLVRGVTWVAFAIPGERIYVVLAEDRVYVVLTESRVYTVPAEDRTYTVPKG